MVVESSTISPSIPILEYSFMDHPLEFEPKANMFEAHMIDLHTNYFLCLIDAPQHTLFYVIKNSFIILKIKPLSTSRLLLVLVLDKEEAPPVSNFQVVFA